MQRVPMENSFGRSDDCPPGFEHFFDWFDRECESQFADRFPGRPTPDEIAVEARRIDQEEIRGSLSMRYFQPRSKRGEPEGPRFLVNRAPDQIPGLPPWRAQNVGEAREIAFERGYRKARTATESQVLRWLRTNVQKHDCAVARRMEAAARLHEERHKQIAVLLPEIRQFMIGRLFEGTVCAFVKKTNGMKQIDRLWWWGDDAMHFVVHRGHPNGTVFVQLAGFETPNLQPTEKARRDCQAWLEGLMRKSLERRPNPKRFYRAQAVEKWKEKLGPHGFNIAWKKAITATDSNWGKPGAPKKS